MSKLDRTSRPIPICKEVVLAAAAKRRNYTELVVASLALAGSGASAGFFIKGYEAIAYSLLAATAGLLAVVLAIFASRYRVYSRFYRVHFDLANLALRLRSFHQTTVRSKSNQEIAVAVETMVGHVLEISARAFTQITGKTCVASLMMPDDENDIQAFRTERYSSNVNPDRESESSNPLPFDEGIIGKALRTGRVISWCLKSNISEFKETRTNFGEFYKSGMTCPVVVANEAFAILNIDANEFSLFDDTERNVAMVFASTLASVFELTEAEWQNGYSDATKQEEQDD